MTFLHGPERILDTGMEGFATGFAVDDDELVATYAVGLFAKGLEEALRGATDEGITGLMSLEVIDLLQAVQVEVGDAQAAAILSGQGVTDLVVPVSVVQPGGKILHIHLGDDVVLLGDLPFLELDLLPEIAAGLLSHFFRKPAVARVHLAVRVGKVEMTAAGPLRRPAKNRGDALVNAQADAGIRNSGDPEHARTDEQVRHGPDDVIVLFAYLAAGHPACEGPERPDGRAGAPYRSRSSAYAKKDASVPQSSVASHRLSKRHAASVHPLVFIAGSDPPCARASCAGPAMPGLLSERR